MANDDTVSVRYMVDDVDDALAFYTKVLGFEILTHPGPPFADVKRGNLRLLLSGPGSSAGQPMPDGTKPEPGGWNRIHFIVDNLDVSPALSRGVLPVCKDDAREARATGGRRR
jgi:catechol 2,3-dioxygenase-like lactoylglutathione lyase family enzyme